MAVALLNKGIDSKTSIKVQYKDIGFGTDSTVAKVRNLFKK